MIHVHQSMDPDTRQSKVFHKLLMSFHMQKKTLRLTSNHIFNQGSFFGEGWGAVGKWKAIWRIVPLKKILVTPLALSIIMK